MVMRRFLLRLFLFTVACAAVFTALDRWLAYRAEGRQFERYADLNIIKQGVGAEVVIVGNSRASYHFDVRVLEDGLGRPCYDLGMIGYPIGDQLGKLSYYLEHNARPQLVVVNVDPLSIASLHRDTIIQYEQFLDDIQDSIVRSIVRDKSGYRAIDRLPFMRFAGFPEYAWKVAVGDTFTGGYRGFVADTSVMTDAIMAKRPPPYDHHHGRLNAYLAAIRAHRDRYWPGVPIAFTGSPVYGDTTQPIIADLAPLLDTAVEHVVRVDLDLVMERRNFRDRTHLNATGAAVYTARFARALRPLLAAPARR